MPLRNSSDVKSKLVHALSHLASEDARLPGDIHDVLGTLDLVPEVIQLVEHSFDEIKPIGRRMCVGMLGTICQMHGDAVLPWVPKMLTIFVEQFKKLDTHIREALCDTLSRVSSVYTPRRPQQLMNILKPLFQAISDCHDKFGQQGVAMGITAVLQGADQFVLSDNLLKVLPRILHFIGLPLLQCRVGLLTAVLALLQAFPSDFAPGTTAISMILPLLDLCSRDSDWQTRLKIIEVGKMVGDISVNAGRSKMAIADGACQGTLTQRHVLKCINPLGDDKVRQVRDAVRQLKADWDLEERRPSITPKDSRPDLSGRENSPRRKPRVASSVTELRERGKEIKSKAKAKKKRESIWLRANEDFFKASSNADDMSFVVGDRCFSETQLSEDGSAAQATRQSSHEIVSASQRGVYDDVSSREWPRVESFDTTQTLPADTSPSPAPTRPVSWSPRPRPCRGETSDFSPRARPRGAETNGGSPRDNFFAPPSRPFGIESRGPPHALPLGNVADGSPRSQSATLQPCQSLSQTASGAASPYSPPLVASPRNSRIFEAMRSEPTPAVSSNARTGDGAPMSRIDTGPCFWTRPPDGFPIDPATSYAAISAYRECAPKEGEGPFAASHYALDPRQAASMTQAEDPAARQQNMSNGFPELPHFDSHARQPQQSTTTTADLDKLQQSVHSLVEGVRCLQDDVNTMRAPLAELPTIREEFASLLHMVRTQQQSMRDWQEILEGKLEAQDFKVTTLTADIADVRTEVQNIGVMITSLRGSWRHGFDELRQEFDELRTETRAAQECSARSELQQEHHCARVESLLSELLIRKEEVVYNGEADAVEYKTSSGASVEQDEERVSSEDDIEVVPTRETAQAELGRSVESAQVELGRSVESAQVELGRSVESLGHQQMPRWSGFAFPSEDLPEVQLAALLDLCAAGQYLNAYRWALSASDLEMLVELMRETGPTVIQYLDAETNSRMIRRLIHILQSCAEVSMQVIIHWLRAVMDQHVHFTSSQIDDLSGVLQLCQSTDPHDEILFLLTRLKGLKSK